MVQKDWSAVEAVALEVLARHGGVAPLRAFVAAGLSPFQVAATYRRGVIKRPRIGWYCEADLPWQGIRAVRVGGVATGVSAAGSWGLPVPPGWHLELQVSVTEHASRLRDQRDRTRIVAAGEDEHVKLHWDERLEPAIGWRTGLLDTLVRLAGQVPEEWFIAAVDAAVHRPRNGSPILGDVDYLRFVMHLPRRLRRALRLVDARSESPIETLLRLGLARRGIGPFDLQVWTTPSDRVDIVVRRRLILEADGEEWHDPEKDAVRDALMRALGYTVLRFSYDRIVADLEAVLDEIEAELARLDLATAS